MAGLIDQQMAPGAAGAPDEEASETPAQEQQEQTQPGGGDADDGAANSPQYKQALELVHQVLYRQGAAKDVAQALRSAPDPADALANTAYDMVSAADEKAGGVPDEDLASLAVGVLGEVADIAEAAGIKVDGAMIAKATQTMLLRFVHENGGDTTQLQQAMSQADPSQVGAALDQHMGSGQQAAPAPQ